MLSKLDEIFDSNYIYLVGSDCPIEIKELKPEGAGVCTFKSSYDALVIRTNDKPTIWAFRNKKCAEGAFVTFNTIEEKLYVNLHIIEMKSRLTSTEFNKVIDQFKGMYLTAISVMALKNIPSPENVYLYVAYKRDAVDCPVSSSLIENKVKTGGEPNIARKFWKENSVQLYNGISGKLIKKERINGDADFGYV